MDEFSSFDVLSDNHESFSWIELLAELDNALQIVVEYVLIFKVQLTLGKSVLMSLDHHKYNLLVVRRTLKKVLQEPLLLYHLLLSILHFFIFRLHFILQHSFLLAIDFTIDKTIDFTFYFFIFLFDFVQICLLLEHNSLLFFIFLVVS
jgi:hypothetical protein